MSASFVKRFNENDDVTSIKYKKYSKEPEDKYPTFSICYDGPQFHWLHELIIFKEYGLTSEQFEQMMMGDMPFRYDYDSNAKLYNKIPTRFNNGLCSNFHSFHIGLSDIMLQADFMNELEL